MPQQEQPQLQKISQQNGVITFKVLNTGQTLSLPETMDPDRVDQIIDGHIRAFRAQKSLQIDPWAGSVLQGSPGLQMASDQAANVLSGAGQAITGIPAGLKALPGMVYTLATSGFNPESADKAEAMLRGVLQPVTASARGIGALAAPNTVSAPTDQEWGQAAQGAGGNLVASELPNAMAGLGMVARPVAAAAYQRLPAMQLPSYANRVQQAAINYAISKGWPVDLATASQSAPLKYLRAKVDTLPIIGRRGAAAREAAEAAVQGAVGSAGGVTAEQAGTSLSTALTNRIAQLNSQANRAYDSIRRATVNAVERVQVGMQTTADPEASGAFATKSTPVFKNVAGATDVSVAKQAAQSIIDEVEPEIPMAQREMNPGLNALKQIAALDDVTDLATADSALQQLKRIVRTDRFSDIPGLKSRSAGIASSIIDPMSEAVDATAERLGVKDALETGRSLVKEKWAVSNALDALPSEPVQIVERLTTQGDKGIEALRTMRKYAPQEMDNIGRSVIEGIFKRATNEGGFKSARALADWERLGDSTKALLFGSKTPELRNIFQYAKLISENVNPSGTARMAAAGSVIGPAALGHPLATAASLLTAEGLSRLIYNPANRQLLTQGLKMVAQPGLTKAANVAGTAGTSTAAGMALIQQAVRNAQAEQNATRPNP